MLLSFIWCNFLVRMLNIFKKRFQIFFFCPQKVEKPPQKVAYLWQLGGFFPLQPRLPKTAQKQGFKNSFIQSSLLRSLCLMFSYFGKRLWKMDTSGVLYILDYFQENFSHQWTFKRNCVSVISLPAIPSSRFCNQNLLHFFSSFAKKCANVRINS